MKITWLRKNWFKLGILLVLFVGATAAYHALVLEPAREKRAATEREAEMDDVVIDYDACVADARFNYLQAVAEQCLSRKSVDPSCREFVVDAYDALDSLRKYQAKYPGTDDQQWAGFVSECGCSLPLALADSLKADEKTELGLCAVRYPPSR